MATNVELIYESNTYSTREPDTDDRWDRGSTETTWYFTGARIVEESTYGSMPYPGELKKGDEVWCVFAVYSTGDTFGHDGASQLEFISIHKTEELAYKNADHLQEDTREGRIEHDDGTVIEMGWKPWAGYFESLDHMYVEKYTLA